MLLAAEPRDDGVDPFDHPTLYSTAPGWPAMKFNVDIKGPQRMTVMLATSLPVI